LQLNTGAFVQHKPLGLILLSNNPRLLLLLLHCPVFSWNLGQDLDEPPVVCSYPAAAAITFSYAVFKPTSQDLDEDIVVCSAGMG
jgi:hypothetical protein